MIFICVRFQVVPEHADDWPRITQAFTEGTRGEPGNLFFEWSRNVEDPSEYVLIEGFLDDAAEAHVTSDHFKAAQRELPPYLQSTPLVRNMQLEGDHWDELGEFPVG